MSLSQGRARCAGICRTCSLGCPIVLEMRGEAPGAAAGLDTDARAPMLVGFLMGVVRPDLTWRWLEVKPEELRVEKRWPHRAQQQPRDASKQEACGVSSNRKPKGPFSPGVKGLGLHLRLGASQLPRGQHPPALCPMWAGGGQGLSVLRP